MIGRAAMGNPYIFKQCIDYVKNGIYDKEEHRQILSHKYLSYAERYSLRFQAVKLQASLFTKGSIGGAQLRDKIQRTKDFVELKKVLSEIA
jgi:tRNA-dihydrouridine synthase